MKISKELVFNYINGSDIPDYDIKDLENNRDFMIEVLKCTKDSKMYLFCSNNLKKDPQFIKSIINIFKNEKEFLDEIVKEYLSTLIEKKEELKEQDLISRNEIIILMTEVNSNKNNYYYDYLAGLIYRYMNTEIEFIKSTTKNDLFLKRIGKGFYILYEKYKQSSIILDYIAKRMAEEIFYEDKNLDFDKLIYTFYNGEKITKNKGINNFIFSYISMYDRKLSEYLILHKDLIKDIAKEINKFQQQFEAYKENENARKVEILYQKVTNFINDNFDVYRLDTLETIDYIVKQLKLENIFDKYDLTRQNIYDEHGKIIFAYDDLYFDYSKISIFEKKKLGELLLYAYKLFSKDTIDMTLNDYDEENVNNNKTKLIKFKIIK